MRATSTPDGLERAADLAATPDALWFVFDGDRKLVLDEGGAVPVGRPGAQLEDETGVGVWGGRTVFAAGLVGELPENWTAIGLRSAFARLSEAEMGLAGYAAQLVDFARTHGYCGRYGAPLSETAHERSRTCPRCGLSVYPRVAPVAMVLVRRREGPATELLLARGPHFAPGMYSALAGFVEPSETLEACATREVLEEVGVQIADLHYVQSQPWPFPHSLMMGFDAVYVGGDIVPQPVEIEDARWFRVSDLPSVPPPFSLARTLIDRAVARALSPLPLSETP